GRLAVGRDVERRLEAGRARARAARCDRLLRLFEGLPEVLRRPGHGRPLVVAGVEREALLGDAFAADRLRPRRARQDAEHAFLGLTIAERRVLHVSPLCRAALEDAHHEADLARQVRDPLRALGEAGLELRRDRVEGLGRLRLVERADLALHAESGGLL